MTKGDVPEIPLYSHETKRTVRAMTQPVENNPKMRKQVKKQLEGPLSSSFIIIIQNDFIDWSIL